MRDGSTRQIAAPEQSDPDFEKWLASWKASVVVTSGAAAGTEYEIDAPSLSLGRGDDVSWSFADDSMSKEHAALEFANGGIRLRDLGSMNGSRVNGAEVKAADLKNGDRFQLGKSSFQFVLEQRPHEPRTYVIEAD